MTPEIHERARTWLRAGPGDFAIAYHVGPRSATGWIVGEDRFPTAEAAEIEAVNRTRRERKAELTPVTRKSVRA